MLAWAAASSSLPPCSRPRYVVLALKRSGARCGFVRRMADAHRALAGLVLNGKGGAADERELQDQALCRCVLEQRRLSSAFAAEVVGEGDAREKKND